MSALFLTHFLGGTPNLNDLKELHPILGRSLQQLLDFEEGVEDLGLTFVITKDNFGETVTHELKPGGANIPVTMKNRQGLLILPTTATMDLLPVASAIARRKTGNWFACLGAEIETVPDCSPENCQNWQNLASGIRHLATVARSNDEEII